ncbi:ABC transporter permease [Phytohabitans kaempferiae]|uniref:ABC transporter permease n=1 Tax=Phytohabitans kaempferiae TaxID=1620943 RepID=A0ABV6MCA4_9ACTN
MSGRGSTGADSYLRLIGRRFGSAPLAVAGAVVLALLVVVAVFAPLIAPYSPDAVDVGQVLKPPSGAHLFGTDELGRDILSRSLYGARVSLLVVGAALAVALLVGAAVGVLSGYLGGWFDALVMRIADALLAFPILVLALAIVAALGPNIRNAAIAIAVVNIPGFARLARGEVLALRHREFIEAARAAGSSTFSILVNHVSRSIAGTMLVYGSLRASVGIITESALSYLGLGAQPPTPTWGGMVATGSQYITEAWWPSFFPGLAIFLAVFSLNAVGDGLNDALNVRIGAVVRRRLRWGRLFSPSARPGAAPVAESSAPSVRP